MFQFGPSDFIQIENLSDSSHTVEMVEDCMKFKIPNNLTYFPNVKLGSYCAVQSESRPSKRRKTEYHSG